MSWARILAPPSYYMSIPPLMGHVSRNPRTHGNGRSVVSLEILDHSAPFRVDGL